MNREIGERGRGEKKKFGNIYLWTHKMQEVIQFDCLKFRVAKKENNWLIVDSIGLEV